MVLQISSDNGATWATPRALAPSDATGRTIRRSSSTPPTARNGLRRVHAGQQVERVRRAVGRLRRRPGAPCWSSRSSAAPTRTSSRRAAATSTSSTTRSRRSGSRCPTTVARPGRRTTSSARHNRQFGVSLPQRRRDRLARAIAYFAWNGVNQPGQAKGDDQPVRHEVDRRRRDLDDLARRRLAGRRRRAAAAAGTTGAAQMALGVDAERPRLRPVERERASSTGRSGCTSPARPTVRDLVRASRRLARAGGVEPRLPGDRRAAATATCGSPGWTIGTATTPAATIPSARWNVYYRSSTDGGTTWSDEAKLSPYVRRLRLQARHPERRLSPAVRRLLRARHQQRRRDGRDLGRGQQLRRPRQRLVRPRRVDPATR